MYISNSTKINQNSHVKYHDIDVKFYKMKSGPSMNTEPVLPLLSEGHFTWKEKWYGCFYVHKSEVFICYPFPIHNTSQQRSTDTLFQKTVPSIVVVKCKINTISILSWEIIYIKQIFYWQNIVYTHTFPFYNYSYMYVLHVCQNQEKLKTIFYSSTSFWSPTLLTSMSRIST